MVLFNEGIGLIIDLVDNDIDSVNLGLTPADGTGYSPVEGQFLIVGASDTTPTTSKGEKYIQIEGVYDSTTELNTPRDIDSAGVVVDGIWYCATEFEELTYTSGTNKIHFKTSHVYTQQT